MRRRDGGLRVRVHTVGGERSPSRGEEGRERERYLGNGRDR